MRSLRFIKMMSDNEQRAAHAAGDTPFVPLTRRPSPSPPLTLAAHLFRYAHGDTL